MTQEWSIRNEAEADAELRAPSVLIVESHSRTLCSVVLAFEEAGMRVYACSTISAAEQALRHQQFDAIVLGMMVEHLFPDELLTLLQWREEVRPLPPVGVLSGLSEEATWACLRPDTLVQGVLPMPLDQLQLAKWRENLLSGAQRPDSRNRVRASATAPRPKSLWAVPV